MKKLNRVEIDEVKYPIVFTMKVGKVVSQEYGSLEGIMGGMEGEKTTSESLDKILFLIKTMIDYGIKRAKKKGESDIPEPPSLEDLEESIEFPDLEEIMQAVNKTVVASKEREVLVKNEGTAQVENEKE